ncbi:MULTISPECIES: alpha-glucosidase C-terminal domain-containing protein [unclassified Bradyrhizobium]|uniref:alpha-glucosidase C-terminal domain-containing protein n=1 Tax=unclassified Bradyrhizobium TaxID=2631580 RepID=UPI001FF96E69|nr:MULTISPECIES: alpha-glucosidase C-terminal domain-containing protein [unclassified Bradyrhizobium]
MPQAASSSVLVQHYMLEGKSVLVLHNLGPGECTTVLHELSGGHKLIDLFGNRVYPAKGTPAGEIELDGYGYRWFRIDSG